MTIRILIVDDYSIIREGLRGFLSCDPDLEVVGEAADGTEAIEKARQLQPDVVLMDLLIPVIDGITVTSTICHELPETEVVVLTNVLERSSVVRAIRAGATGYLLKDAHADELRSAVKAAAAGQVQLSPAALVYLLHEIRTPEHPEPLTERETDVLRLLAQGATNKEIASTLRIAEDTVRNHVRHILAKLGVQRRTQAALAAMRIGLVAHEPGLRQSWR